MRIRTSVCLDQSPEMRLNSDENETPCCAKSGFLMNKRRPWVSGSEIERVPGQRLVVIRWLARKKRVRTMLIRTGFPRALGWVSRGGGGAARRGGAERVRARARPSIVTMHARQYGGASRQQRPLLYVEHGKAVYSGVDAPDLVAAAA